MSNNQTTPIMFHDRIPVNTIQKNHPDVLDILRLKNLGKIETRETVHFCGLVSVEEGNSIFFLPRQTRAVTAESSVDQARLTMRVLARFGREVESRKGVDPASTANASMIALIYDLVNDFRQNGIYSERVRFTSRNQGKPDWPRTLTRNMPMLNSNRRPVYSEIATQRSIDAHENLLSLVQAEVLREIMSQHSWWIGGLDSRVNELHSFETPAGTRDKWSRKLKMHRQNLFSNRALFLTEALVEYLDGTASETTGGFLYGVEDFQTVWETMLRQILPDVEAGWNSRLPKPGYVRCHDGSVAMQERGMQTDIIIRTGNQLNIVDAKYYDATGIRSVPGWSDIVKQLFYERAVKSVDPSLIIKNFFVFPSSSVHLPEFSEIRLFDQEGRTIDSFAKINCKYIDTKSAMDAYVKRKKLENMFC